MLTLTQLKSKLTENSGILDSFIYQGKRVIINNSLQVSVNEELINIEFKNLEEAREYAKTHINTSIILEDIGSVIPEEKIVNLVSKYHTTVKITDTIVESYLELASSNLFTIDPVLVEIKQKNTSLPGKIEHKLNDGNMVSITEETQNLLNTLLEDKYQVVEYMRESKENFMHVIRTIKE
jgi:hypothetical protein